MKYYAPINYPPQLYYCLQQNAIRYLNRLDLVHSIPESTSLALDLSDTLTHVPEITQLLDTLDLKPAKIFMFKAGNTFGRSFLSTITAAYSTTYGAVELPVIGCEFSTIEFYAAKPKAITKYSDKVYYVTVDEDTAQLVDQVKLTSPMIIQHRAPQKIVLERQFVTRISLRITCTTDPANLL